MIDFNKLGLGNISKQIDPRDIFMGLIDKDKAFQYPRDVQGEVWKQWFEVRNNTDNIIKMNTGSGKTVVALMILQSCLNEGVGPALYVVPDPYLVNQVIKQAKLLGIRVTDTERDLDYQRKKAILVVNIQKLVNGKSVFGMRDIDNYPIGSVVIDDIHACMITIQEQFSITIPKDEVYNEIIGLFYDTLNIQAEGRFQELVNGRNKFENMIVPFWDWQEKEQDVYKILSRNTECDYLKYKYDLVKDVLKLSHCYITHNKIQIIPNLIPIHKISSFEEATRRIYLSATLPDDSPFSTLLGVDFNKTIKIISPEKANDIGERLILTPRTINKDILDDDVRYMIANMSHSYNVVVIVPSFTAAQFWQAVGATILSKDNIIDGVEKLKQQSYGLTVIVNRYDGIDLPDDACRVLVIDGLPNTTNLHDKYELEIVRKSERIQREQIQRIEQGMGRGIRANNDYCLVFLVGNKLTDVLYLNDGFEYFSSATKEQFKLSERMCEQIEGGEVDEIIQVCDYILKRDKQWTELCKSVTSNISYPKEPNINQIVVAQRRAFDLAEIGEYQKAVYELNVEINKMMSKKYKGYYKQLLAEYVNLYDKHEAQQILKSAKMDN